MSVIEKVEVHVAVYKDSDGFWCAKAGIKKSDDEMSFTASQNSRSRERAISYALTEAAVLIERGR